MVLRTSRTHTALLSSGPMRLLCGVKGHPGDLPGQTITWSGTRSVWKSKAFMLPSPCFLQLGGFGPILAVSLSHLPCASGLPVTPQLEQPFLSQTPHTFLRFSRAFLEVGSWLCQTGMGLPNGWNSVMVCIHLPLVRKSKQPGNTKHHWPTSSLVSHTNDKELVSHC